MYNHANYEVRQYYISEGKYLDYYTLDKVMKRDLDFPDYRLMPSAVCAQQTLRLLDKSWKSFFESIKDWKKNPSKYTGMPKLPGYKPKDGYFPIILTNQAARLKGDRIVFPKTFLGLEIKPQCIHKENYVSYQQVRFIPRVNHIVAEIVYKLQTCEVLPDNGRHLGIDLGFDNFATVVNNFGEGSFVLNGKHLKAINQWYNKLKSGYQSVAMTSNNKHVTNRIHRITCKRNRKINDLMHKMTRYILDYAQENNVTKIVVGYNKGWKNGCNLGKRNNQTFTHLPFARFIEMLKYKAEELGIEIISNEESFTSGTSFIDGEEPIRANYDKRRRKYRGLFVSNDNIEINADVNGAYQILSKVFPIKWDSRCALHPVIVTVT